MYKINKKYCFMFMTIVFFIFTHKVNASVIINEVQISPTENRFLELYNNGSSSVDLTGWYIQRKTSTGTTYGSLVSKTYFEGKTIDANGYFVISKNDIENTDIICEALTLTESNSLQIKNNGGDVVFKIGWGESLDCDGSCVENPGENKSISRVSNGSYIITAPTPGLANIESSNIDNTIIDNPDTVVDGQSGSSSSLISKNKEPEIYKITTKIIAPKIVTAGVPFTINHQTTGLKKEKVILGKFVWNFGDGMKRELSISPEFDYIYQYEGEYVLTLYFYNSILDVTPSSTDRVVIKVIPSGIVISSVGNSSDPFIEIKNDSNYEMSLHDWTIKGILHSFIIPEGMIILPNKKLKLSPKVTGFDFNDLSNISIMDSSGQIFATYPKQNITTYRYYSNKNSQTNIVKSEVAKSNDTEGNPNVINLNDLGSNIANSNDYRSLSKSFYVWSGLIIIIVIGLASVYLLRRKEEYPDYVERKLTANDMTIIE